MTGSGNISVLTAAHFDPGTGRIEMELPEGMTVDAIVRAALPAATTADHRQLRVALVSEKGSQIILPEYWGRVRPRPGVRVVIRVIAGKNALRSVLQIVVAITALIVAPMIGAALAGTFGLTSAVWTGVAGLGINLVGNLLINALVPPPKDERPQNRYTIQGWRNRLDPNGAVPQVLGTVRYAPPFAARSWTEIVGDFQYVRALFTFGYGPLHLTDFRLGETSLADYDEVEIEVREGRSDDLPMSFFPTQIVEENVGTELLRPLPRNDLGEVERIAIKWPHPEEGPFTRWELPEGIETPVVRTTGADATGASVILVWPAGLFRMNDDGAKLNHTVVVRIEQRLIEAEEWQLVEALTITGRKLETFYRQHIWDFPTRGRWQVRLTMMTRETEDSKIQQRTAWAGLQTIRPEYPLNFNRPLALVALRIKATHQINGQLDNFSALAGSYCLDWDHETESWVERQTSNPASLYRHVLQSPANIHPEPDSGIDLPALQDWHDFCRVKGLRYDAAHDQASMILRDVLAEIAAAGRATPRHDGLRWSVTVDRPADLLLVDHVNPRNSREFRAARRYFKPPDAVRVQFLDAENDFQPAERIVRWPGHEGSIDVTEALPLPGKVHAAEVWREARRRMYEAIHRPDSYQCIQDGAVRVATRGDLVTLSHFVLNRVEAAARVREVQGALVVLDDQVALESGKDYAIRFRHFDGSGDQVGTSVVRQITGAAGETELLQLTGDGPAPLAGDLIHFGPAGQVDHNVVLRGIEAGEDMASVLHMIDASPQIDEIVDAEEAPPWSSRVGDELDFGALAPPVPRFTSIVSGASGTEEAGLVEYRIEPGIGAVITAEFEVQHRLASAMDWTTIIIPAASGGGQITGYETGDPIVLRATALSFAGTPSAPTAEIALTVGENDAELPAALDPEAISVTTLLGGVLIMFATGSDEATEQVQVYRSTSATLNRDTDGVGAPIPVAPQQSYSTTLGDTTRSNLLANSGFDSAASWTMDESWEIDAGVATHAPGDAGAIGQPLAAEAGRFYRIGYQVLDRSAGTLTPRLTGGSTRTGTAVAVDEYHLDRIQAVSGNDHIEWLASDTFDGSLDDVVAYTETAACLTQGTHFIWLEPQNEDGVPGPVFGPIEITII